MNEQKIQDDVDDMWHNSIVDELVRYIEIPCKSPHFEPDWEKLGHLDSAVAQFESWAKALDLAGLQIEVVRLPGRTPLLFMEVPGTEEGSVLLYGHLDKQPEMSGWRGDLGPWKPVIEDGKLYGRGGADDGYAMFASLAALKALSNQGIPHARCTIIIEACEESGSFDLPPYIEALRTRIGQPDLVVCLDSGCGDYERLWSTTSLRGMVSGVLRVDILTEGVHSGDASGVVPSSFRIARELLSRIEDPNTGAVLVDACHTEIPAARRAQAKTAAAILDDSAWRRFPFAGNAQAMHTDVSELILNRTWRPALSVTGADGLPALADAGNVLRPTTALQLSMRIPPGVDSEQAALQIKQILEQDPPYDAQVSFDLNWQTDGWEAPALTPWLEKALGRASQEYFSAEPAWMGEGGTIPFMAMLGDAFPDAQFVITGVLGPHSNAHGPNEFLHLECARRLSACVASIVHSHSHQRQ